jgi:hypothetical protein
MVDYDSCTETGAELLTSLISENKSSFSPENELKKQKEPNNVNSNTFKSVVNSKCNFIEIFGKSGSEKSELLMNFIVDTIIPSSFEIYGSLNKTYQIKSILYDSKFKEKNCTKAIYINTDGKFNFYRLFNIVEKRLLYSINFKILSLENIDKQNLNDQIRAIVFDVLKNLVVYRCINFEQFFLAIFSCQLYVKSSNINSCLPIFFDTIDLNVRLTKKHDSGLNEMYCYNTLTVLLINKLLNISENVFLISTHSNGTIKDNISKNLGIKIIRHDSINIIRE